MINRSIRAAATSISSIILVACAQPAYIPEDVAAPPLPEDDYRSAALRGESVYRIDPARSRVFIQVGRGGAMKTAGHDHLIVSEDVEGLVLVSDDPTVSRAHLRIPLQRLIVDRPAYRQRFGLKADISESSINGTTRNMQEKVLASSLYPWAEIQVKFASAYDELAVQMDRSFEIASVEPLTPEQLARSTMQAVGFVAQSPLDGS